MVSAMKSMRVLNLRNATYFRLSVIAFFTFSFLTQGSWLVSPGMWAENATVYWGTAQDGFQLDDLLVRDAGYLPVLLHLIAALIQAFNPAPNLIPLIYAWAGLVVMFIPTAIFQHKSFRGLIARDSERFLIVLLSLFFLGTWGTTHFLNSTYSFVFLTFVLALKFFTSRRLGEEGESRTPIWILGLMILGMLTKPAVLAFVPLLSLSLLHKSQRIRVASLFSLALASLQFLTLVDSRFRLGVLTQETQAGLLQQLASAIQYFVTFPIRFLAGPLWTDLILSAFDWFLSVSSFILGMLFWAFLVRIFQKSRDQFSRDAVLASSFALASAVSLNVSTLPDMWNAENLRPYSVPLNTRSLSLFVITILLLFFCLKLLRADTDFRFRISRFWQRFAKHFSAWRLITWLFMSGWAIWISFLWLHPGWPITGNSNWNEVDLGSTDAQRCVTLDPWAWGAWGTGCGVASWTDYSSSDATRHHSKGAYLPLSGLEDRLAGLDAIAIAIHSDRQAETHFTLEIQTAESELPTILNGEIGILNGTSTYVIYLERPIYQSDIDSIWISLEPRGSGSIILLSEGSDFALGYLVVKTTQKED